MKMNTTVKWILIAVLILIGLAFVIYLFLNWPRPVQPGPTPGPTPPGGNWGNILQGFFSSDWIKKLFGGTEMGDPACQSTNPGYDNNGFYTRACGGVPGGGTGNCNPDDPGKDMYGFNSSQCGG